MEPTTTARQSRRVAALAVTVLAVLLVAFALLAPDDGRLTPWSFARIPVEALVAVPVLLLLPARVRRVVAVGLGAAAGLLILLTVLDMGFQSTLGRPFHPAFDWSSFGPAVALLVAEVGSAAAIALVVVAAGIAVGLLIAGAAAVVRLTRVAVEHRRTATRTTVALGLVWLACAISGVQIVPGEPVAARSAAATTYDRIRQVGTDFRDQRRFAADMAVDAFRDVPGEDLLTALRGKDVVIAFVESYGRVALEHPDIAPRVTRVLTAGDRGLHTAGFATRSAFLASPTSGGTSWLAHATLQSGLWVDNPLRYDSLVGGDRLTLSGAFRRAGWRTAGVVPANTEDWPEREFYGIDGYYDSRDIAYRGPRFSFETIPDQYTLAAFHRAEVVGAHAPVMAEIDLVSSHWPWRPVPPLVSWSDLGDGSVLAGKPSHSPDGVRTAYAESIAYSLRTLISYARTHGDDDLVLIFLGDHQPVSMVTGEQAGRDVPITIVTRDEGVLDRIAGWGWQPSLRPREGAPVWPMDAFRDRFLTAFG
ncbi:LTA synthase family protein [Haloechinothrix halophila]|uniref:sulfatase n=1 Tax=Haloechinothrix halophila TaxID=1069073 RepID=UPI0003F79D04|nr:sulfatase [Haloechinothrix halophila]